MDGFGKGRFGNPMEINAQVVNGQCPFCHTDGILVSVYKTVFRCITCGSDVEKLKDKQRSFSNGGNH